MSDNEPNETIGDDLTTYSVDDEDQLQAEDTLEGDDLEDVLDYIFNEGFVEPKYRPVSWWEKTCGEKVKGSLNVDELLSQGVGKCEETALRLIIGQSQQCPLTLTLVLT